VPTLPKWREAEGLARLVQFVVIPRPGEAVAPSLPPFRVQNLAGWPLKVSSSEIRARAQAALPIAHLVPFGVDEVIRETRSYQTKNSP
jgi:nicotinate-nucleotide adenylyltransferase